MVSRNFFQNSQEKSWGKILQTFTLWRVNFWFFHSAQRSVKVCKFFPHDVLGNFEIFPWNQFVELSNSKNGQDWFWRLKFLPISRQNLLSKICKVGFRLIESIGILRTSLDAGCFYVFWSLLTSTAISSALGEYIWKISSVLSRVMSLLHFMFSLGVPIPISNSGIPVFWYETQYRIPVLKMGKFRYFRGTKWPIFVKFWPNLTPKMWFLKLL